MPELAPVTSAFCEFIGSSIYSETKRIDGLHKGCSKKRGLVSHASDILLSGKTKTPAQMFLPWGSKNTHPVCALSRCNSNPMAQVFKSWPVQKGPPCKGFVS